jgi:hypothetical protein
MAYLVDVKRFEGVLSRGCLAMEAFVLGMEGLFLSPAIGRDAKPLAAAAPLVIACYKSPVEACRI